MKKSLFFATIQILTYLIAGVIVIGALIINLISPFFAVIILACILPLMSALNKLFIWKKRHKILTDDELKHSGIKIFFALGICEVFFAVCSFLILLS